ncbi:hypothetical protein JMJ77_0005377 [Colletotrichum scovillei]|uniref:Uncharacterized protein n=1 Tax=Colletotrichum scovillei TaxID=1209932 RepID=A0A9P7RH24_9PEZI|nr:hypothetical protein JMJ77_0005377 [Colletotrichum scovillei]KAG7076594.1 hypothetical protein JMJ76_0013856 [Colletotrichum scovillei]KAG7083703.1 hypothetical protein JMJ78_0009146 [Colletotrichum scovillei]
MAIKAFFTVERLGLGMVWLPDSLRGSMRTVGIENNGMPRERGYGHWVLRISIHRNHSRQRRTHPKASWILRSGSKQPDRRYECSITLRCRS